MGQIILRSGYGSIGGDRRRPEANATAKDVTLEEGGDRRGVIVVGFVAEERVGDGLKLLGSLLFSPALTLCGRHEEVYGAGMQRKPAHLPSNVFCF